ncbi:MAG TPA: pitrilysin family protein [Bacteroidota bacterium]|nr:pitrilysin family protein [Bacteroidota bacterium]
MNAILNFRRLVLSALGIALVVLTFATAHARQAAPEMPPKLGPPPSLQLPPIRHFTLSNGLKVTLMEKHNVPLVQTELVVWCGSVNDPPGKSGLASMSAAMMEEGAGSRNSLELADAIDFLGADISAFAGNHTSGVVLHTPLSKLDSALALFADMALRPTFPAEELERNRKERLTSLMEWHDQPRAIASVIFNRTLFGANHPYGIPSMGNEQSLRSFTVEDLKNFHKTYFYPNNGFMVVSGDITEDQIKPKLESLFGGWSRGDVEIPKLPAVSQVESRKIYLVDKPGAAQSVIRIGRIGADRMTKDYFPLLVMNTILGGSFTSRLNHNIREVHGYSYGAGSGFDFRPTPGPFTAAADVQTNVTDKALTEFMNELKGIRVPVSDDELTRAKNYLALRYPESFQTVSQLTGQLSDLNVYGLPDDYFNNYVQEILAVTKEDVQRVAQKYIDPDKIAIIIVGDRKLIEPGISALNLGPIENLTVEDVLGKAPEPSN